MTARNTRRGFLCRAAGAVAALSIVGSGAVTAKRSPGRDSSRSDFADDDGNGFADEGEVVTGRYRAIYAYDGNGDIYTYNLSNRHLEGGTVAGVDDLDETTRTVCYYNVQYRGTFGNDAYQESGWIKNVITCKGRDKGSYTRLYVHTSDPRYTGDRPEAFGGDWEYHVDTESGSGNTLVTDTRPANGI